MADENRSAGTGAENPENNIHIFPILFCFLPEISE